MCDEAVDTYHSTIQFVRDCYSTQEMCDQAINRCAFAYIPDWYKTQEMCVRVVSENLFKLVYCPNRYKTQKMCDEAVVWQH